MEITINTKNKTIEIKEDVNIMELVEFLEDAIGDKWREYKILKPIEEVNYIPYYPITPYSPSIPYIPWYPDITYGPTLTTRG